MADEPAGYLQSLFYSALAIGETTRDDIRMFAINSPIFSFLDSTDAKNMMFVDKEISEITKIYHDCHKFPLPLFSFHKHVLLGERIQIRLKGNKHSIVRFEPAKITWNIETLELWFDRSSSSAVWGRTKFTFESIGEYNAYRSAFELFIPKIKARLAKKAADQKAVAAEKRRVYYEWEARKRERELAEEAAEQARIDAEKKQLLADKMRIGPSGYKPPIAPWAKTK